MRPTSTTDQPQNATATSAARNENKAGIWRLAICSGGICVCYLYYGMLQERLFTDDEQRLGTTFVLLTQCATNSLVAKVWQNLQEKWEHAESDPRPLRHGVLLITAACYVTAMTCSNEAIQYVSYPVAVLAKSCKLIPTMLVGQLVEKRLYSTQEWFAALCISIGIVLFQVSRETTTIEHDHSIYGMGLLLASLIMDGVLSSCQNILKREHARYRSPNAVETMLYVNLFAILYLVPLCLGNTQWSEGMFALQNNSSLVQSLTILNATVAVGQIFVFLAIVWYVPSLTLSLKAKEMLASPFLLLTATSTLDTPGTHPS
jgi:solute carrier family 35 (UDP-galactose transporter), member B1